MTKNNTNYTVGKYFTQDGLQFTTVVGFQEIFVMNPWKILDLQLLDLLGPLDPLGLLYRFENAVRN